MVSIEQIINVLSPIITCRTLVKKNITTLKEEKDGPDEIIDSVTYISFNDWIRCQVSFVAKASNYKVWLIFEIIYYYCVYLTKF
ncbi:unnamed protein product [Rotaria sordida]|uniref:Uncharacterized protein n=1 Tax=Rotaria sordida TaxID=392033 RepID=A0A819J5A1_9BILA|nr:unnamed protein product [Rotaria sordida]CAF1357028.1 unnamed protein product [Rotaria sordida]CAF3924736.1 unnamed protein product [Rotaria sordida]CAF3926590.1 unnamed protein product [Rotaria sordida]